MNKEELSKAIDKEALRELCIQYDIEYGDYPEAKYEGYAIYTFFLHEIIGNPYKTEGDIWKALCDKSKNEDDNCEVKKND